MNVLMISRCSFFAALVAVTVLAVLPQDTVVVSTGWDKTNHCAAFFFLVALFDAAYPGIKPFWLKLMVMLGYGVFLEGLQSLMPGRFASALDVLADGAGLLLYSLCRVWVIKQSPSFKRYLSGKV